MSEMKVTGWRVVVFAEKGGRRFLRLGRGHWFEAIGESWELCYADNDGLEKEYLSMPQAEDVPEKHA